MKSRIDWKNSTKVAALQFVAAIAINAVAYMAVGQLRFVASVLLGVVFAGGVGILANRIWPTIYTSPSTDGWRAL